jgi:hypothetical protein
LISAITEREATEQSKAGGTMNRTVVAISVQFIKWGLGLFIFGVFVSLGPIGHYCMGARWPLGEEFLKNITLWWGCPWTLAVAALQIGGLGMVALGLARLFAARLSTNDLARPMTPIALLLCVVGLLGVFVVGYPGYFVFDAIWPSFYYSPVVVGKNAWLLPRVLHCDLFHRRGYDV